MTKRREGIIKLCEAETLGVLKVNTKGLEEVKIRRVCAREELKTGGSRGECRMYRGLRKSPRPPESH